MKEKALTPLTLN